MTLRAVIAGPARSIDAARALAARFDFDAVEAWPLRDNDFGSIQFSAAISHLILAGMPSIATARALLQRAAEAGARVLLCEHERIRPMRLDDLVAHPAPGIDWARIRSDLAGKRVLITGGGGSIGSALARAIAKMDPSRLTLLDCSEHNLVQVAHDVPTAALALADIRDGSAMRRWLGAERPHLVFHTAALKHVPIVEKFPAEGVRTNVFGLRNVAEAAHDVGADLIFLSTDKAAEATGIMGASKRLGELYCQALDRRGPQRAVPVRLVNVLGSAGSVAPLFEAQLAAGGPLTVTDAEVTRFFITIPQAADLILHAAASSFASPARGLVLSADLSAPQSIVELASDVIRLAGKRPGKDVSIAFTGLRPGEKVHERLIGDDEWRAASAIEGLIAADSTPRALAALVESMDRLALLAGRGADAAVAAEIFTAIAEPVSVPGEGAKMRALAG